MSLPEYTISGSALDTLRDSGKCHFFVDWNQAPVRDQQILINGQYVCLVVATNDYDEPKETRVWVHESAKILDFRVSEPDLVELNTFGHVVIWCPNDRAPKPPMQEPISPTCHVNISPYSVVRVNGVLCWAKQIQVGLSRQAQETRFLAEKIK